VQGPRWSTRPCSYPTSQRGTCCRSLMQSGPPHSPSCCRTQGSRRRDGCRARTIHTEGKQQLEQLHSALAWVLDTGDDCQVSKPSSLLAMTPLFCQATRQREPYLPGWMCCECAVHSLDGLVNESLDGCRPLVAQCLSHARTPPHKQGVVKVVLETSLHIQIAACQSHTFARGSR
jgi:hypothetical protein